MVLLLSAVRFLPAQDLVDVPFDCLQLLEPPFLFPVAVVKAVFLKKLVGQHLKKQHWKQ